MSYRMKKICALLCAATLMGSLSACVAASAISTTKNNTETEATATATSSGQLDASEMFTDRDKEIGYDDTSAVSIELSDSSASCDSRNVTIDGSTITITQEGTYVLSGNLSDGQIVVDADAAKVQLVLNGVDITKKSSSAIYVKSADKVFVTLADGTENKLTTSGTFETDDDNNIDAVIFSKEDITLNGKGSLTVSTEDGNGITSKDDLKITSGTYNITASGHGLEGKDSVRIADGTITITAGKDGIHSDNTEDAGKGFVYISGGKLDITSTGDGIDASNVVQVDDGEVNIVAGGGSANSTKTHNMGPGGGKGGERPSGDMPGGEKPSGDMPGGEKPSGDMPGGEKPGGNMPGGEKPSGDMPGGNESESEKSGDENSENDTNSTGNSTSDNKSVSTDKNADTDNSTSDSSDTVSTKGIKADNNLYINGGTFNVDSADDSFQTNMAMTVSGGTFTISSGDDAMHADGALLVSDGSIDISKSYEGLEGITVTVDGGDIKIVSSDDGINAAGDDTSVSSLIEINGGTVYVNAEGDGIDSNGDIKINGGELTIDGPANDGNSAIDIGDGANGYINGGTVIAIGCAGMVEEFDTSSEQAMINVQVSDDNISGEVVLTDSDGNEIISYTPAKSYDCVQISSSMLKTGETYTLKAGDTTTSISLDNIIYSNISRNMRQGA